MLWRREPRAIVYRTLKGAFKNANWQIALWKTAMVGNLSDTRGSCVTPISDFHPINRAGRKFRVTILLEGDRIGTELEVHYCLFVSFDFS